MTTRPPQWWQLYGLGALMLGALIWAHRLGLAEQAEMVIQVGILAVTFGLISAWISANGPALLNQDDVSAPVLYHVRLDEPADAPSLAARPGLNGAGGHASDEQPAAAESAIAGSVLD